jgi:hypothetical protein
MKCQIFLKTFVNVGGAYTMFIASKQNYGFACKLHVGLKIDTELSCVVSINVLKIFINIVM